MDQMSAVDPKSKKIPVKKTAKETTPAMYAQHIGYHWVVDRSITGCYNVQKLNSTNIRPAGLWDYIMMITNFVHDKASLKLIVQVLNNNGSPSDTLHPFDISKLKLSSYPKLFGQRQREHCHHIMYGILKPQMMLYNAFLVGYKKQHKEFGEVNIRNRF
jgi:hypothetical protein